MAAFMRNGRLKHSASVYFAIIIGQRTLVGIPMRSFEFFILLNPSGHAMSLRSTRARIFPGGKGGPCIGLTTLPLYVPIV